MYEIPTKINLNGEEFQIRNNGDYRMVLDCFGALQDAELPMQYRLLVSLIIFYEDINSIDDIDKFPDVEEAVTKMYNFFNCNQPQSMGNKSTKKLIDWEQDAQLVCSAINNVANVEIRSVPYIHWWTFMGYYSAIDGDSLLATVVRIRSKLLKGKKLEKYEREFKISNPEYFVWNSSSTDQDEAQELLKELWNNED